MKVGLEGSQCVFGQRDDPHRTINYPRNGSLGSHERNVALESWVDWKDSIEGDGLFRVIAFAEATSSRALDERSLQGKVFIYRKCYEENGSLQNKANSLLQLVKELEQENLNGDGGQALSKARQVKLNSLFGRLKEKLSISTPLGIPEEKAKFYQHQYVVSFFVAHNGLTFLQLDEKDVSEVPPVSDITRYTVIRQAFYYLKYGIHTHKHHDAERDALTTVVPITQDSDTSSIWLQLVGQLKRELVRIKRAQESTNITFENHEHHTAEGIIGYIATLLAQLKFYKFIDENCYKREIDSLTGVGQSISAHKAKLHKEEVHQWRREDTSRTFLLYVTTFIGLSCAATYYAVNLHWPDPETRPDWIVPIFEFVVALVILGLAGTAINLFLLKRLKSPVFIEHLMRQVGIWNKKRPMQITKVASGLAGLFFLAKSLVEYFQKFIPELSFVLQ